MASNDPRDMNPKFRLTVALSTLPKAGRGPGRECEDAFALDEMRGMVAVFDGMGGRRNGALAARTAAQSVNDDLQRIPARTDIEGRRRWLRDAVENANWNVAGATPGMRASGAGATCAICMIAETAGETRSATVLYTSVGDSRVYLYSPADSRLTLLTDDGQVFVDENVREELNEAETPEDLTTKLARNLFSSRRVVTGTLGQMRNLAPVNTTRMSKDDCLIVCTDGLHDNLTGTEIQAICESAFKLADRADVPETLSGSLTDAARIRSLESGHMRAKDDDITVATLTISTAAG